MAPPFQRPQSGHVSGSPEGLSKKEPEVYTIRDFEQGFFFGDQSKAITTAHIRAYIQTFVATNISQHGVPAAHDFVLKAKSWAPTIEPYTQAWVPSLADLGGWIRARQRTSADIGAACLAVGSVSLPASIHGFVEEDLPAFLKAWSTGTGDIPAFIHGFHIRDFAALLVPLHTEPLTASIETIPPRDLLAFLQTIEPVGLPANVLAVASVNLGASGGGHFPEDLPGFLSVTQPVDIPAYIRGGWSASLDLGASLTQVGYFEGVAAFVRAAQPGLGDVAAALRVVAQSSYNLAARLSPIHVVDLSASIITQRVFGMCALIYGYVREAEANLPSYIRRVDSVEESFPVAPIKAVISTHTSDRLPNLDKVARPFFQNRYVFGTQGAGFTLLTLEPVFGVFPDLHAEIFARDFYRSSIRGFVRAAQSGILNLPSQMTSVVPFLNVNKILLSLIPLLGMEAELVQVGVIAPVRGSITPSRSAATGTAADAGFVTTAASYRFYLGTSRGLFVPPQIVPEIRLTTYRNDFPLPDLHATVSAWYVSDFGASIRDYPFTDMSATATALDIDHLRDLSASVAAFRVRDLSASLVVSGGHEALPASLTVRGAVSDLGAALVPFINPLAFNVVSVSTSPLLDMGAIINYGTLVRCSPTSVVVGLGAFIKTVVTGTAETVQNLGAELNVLRMVDDLLGEVVGRKRTRIQVLSLTFRSRTRSSVVARASLTPVIPRTSGVSAEIIGLLHEVDLSASLTPFRYAPTDVDFTATERVVNLETASIKDILVSFRSQVNFYVYEDVISAVYSTDRGTWAIDLRSLDREESFYDRSSVSRQLELSDLQEFYSLDEAIRNAVVLLCERRQTSFSASLTARGSIGDMGVVIGITSSDRMFDLFTSIVPSGNSPDIAASINPGPDNSRLAALLATLTPESVQVLGSIGCSIVGNIVDDLGAEITAS